MRELEKPVARVFRRLRYQRFRHDAGVVVGDRAGHRGRGDRRGEAAGPQPAGSGLGAVRGGRRRWGCWWPRASRPSPDRAGWTPRWRIDRVFHLNERLSSALTLPEDLRETPAGRALIADAVRKVTDLDVAAEFGLRLPRRAWVVLIPATAAVLLLFAPAWVSAIAPRPRPPSRSTPRRSPSRPRC